MRLLDAVNQILPKLGEHTVTRVDVRHPTLAVIIPAIEQFLKETLLRDWWFNGARLKLYPNSEGQIDLPTNLLSYLPDHQYVGSVRGKRLYNNGTGSFVWPGPVEGWIKEYVAFEDLPESVAIYVFYGALVSTYLTDIGLEQIVQEWKDIAAEAKDTAASEHLKNARYTTQKSARWRRLSASLRG